MRSAGWGIGSPIRLTVPPRLMLPCLGMSFSRQQGETLVANGGWRVSPCLDLQMPQEVSRA